MAQVMDLKTRCHFADHEEKRIQRKMGNAHNVLGAALLKQSESIDVAAGEAQKQEHKVQWKPLQCDFLFTLLPSR